MVSAASSARRWHVLLGLLAAESGLVVMLALGGAWVSWKRAPDLASNRVLARHLRLTALALWPEATYARHPRLSDLFTPLSSHPGALEHFPAGSLVPPDRVPPPREEAP